MVLRLLPFAPLFWLSALMCAQGSARTFFPASIPLAIRSPYMNVWDISTNGSAPLSSSSPVFWGQQSLMGWAGRIRIDGRTYAWMGRDGDASTPTDVLDVQITPTRSIFVMQAGPMNVTVTFLSPIEPADWVKQSLPFSYVYLEASSVDGLSHSVQVYSDITAEWVSGNRTNSLVQWDIQNTGSAVYHEIQLQDVSTHPNKEVNHQAQDGTAYHAMASRSGLTWQIDRNASTRDQFLQHGTLLDTASTDFGTILRVSPTFAIAVDLGTIEATPSPVAWAVGYVRDPVIEYTTISGATEQQRPLFMTEFSNIGDAIAGFTADFGAARDRAIALDQRIMQGAAKISSEYVDLVSLATRQTLGSLDITAANESNGHVDASDVKIFMKDIGTSGRTNPVERMFAALPIFLYLNASLCGALLKPLLESQDILSQQPYALQDLGPSYPLAQAVPGTHDEGIEQTGNMLIMLLAYARVSGDGSLLEQHYNLTKRWTDYLVNGYTTVFPSNQESADSEGTANMINLALKGIIAVKAMAEISRAVGIEDDATHYDNRSSAFMSLWQSQAVSSNGDRVLGTYDDQQSWSLLYNLYADRLLGTNLVSDWILQNQTKFYSTLLQSTPLFGPPIDSTPSQINSASWSLLTSATVTDNTVRDELIQGVWKRASFNTTQGAFTDHYDGATGAVPGPTLGGTAGPALGAMYAHLALTVPNTTIVVSGNNPGGTASRSPNTNKLPNVGAIVGEVLGTLAVVAIAACAFVFFWRRKNIRREADSEKIDTFGQPHQRKRTPPLYRYRSWTKGAMRRSLSPSMKSEVVGDAQTVALSVNRTREYGVQSNLAAPSSLDLNWSEHVVTPPEPRRDRPSKARERALNTDMHHPESTDRPSPISRDSAASDEVLGDSASLGRSGSEMLSADGVTLSPTDVLSLRNEVENLRRVMLQIRAERLEPPPEYVG